MTTQYKENQPSRTLHCYSHVCLLQASGARMLRTPKLHDWHNSRKRTVIPEKPTIHEMLRPITHNSAQFNTAHGNVGKASRKPHTKYAMSPLPSTTILFLFCPSRCTKAMSARRVARTLRRLLGCAGVAAPDWRYISSCTERSDAARSHIARDLHERPPTGKAI